MDFRQLEAFVNVAKYKNFSKAGKVLYLSQPTISLHISNLEKELSTVLFDRTSKEVNLTPAGKDFLNYALDLINMKNRALHQLSSNNHAITGSVTISTSSTPNIVLLPDAIERFQKLHPEVRFIIEEKSTTLILEDVCSLNAEIGIVGMKVENDRFISTHLYDDELVFVCHPDLPLDGVIDLSTLSSYKLISRTDQSATRLELERSISEQGFDIALIENLVESDNMNFMIHMVQRGLGVGYISKTIYECYRKVIALKSFKVKGLDLTTQTYLLTNRKRTLSPAVEDFVNLLKTMDKPK